MIAWSKTFTRGEDVRSKANASVQRTWFLNSHKLCAQARCSTGLHDFGDPAIELRLGTLVDSLNSEANLHLPGRFLARAHFKSLLETRLRLVESWRKLDGVESQPIERPIFIVGMPRTGSSFLHDLFVQDSDNRGPLVWETMFPPNSAPADPREVNQRIRQTARCLWWFRQIARQADAVHPMRATTPHECVAIHSYTFLSREFPTTFEIPSYGKFLSSTDFRPAYAWEKRFLQYLQWRNPAKRWILKAPDHVFDLDALFAIFPDAVLIQTHRDPSEVLRSSLRLKGVLRRMFAHPEVAETAARREALRLADGMDRITRFRDAHPELTGRFLDVHYSQLVSDPVGTVRRLYQQLDLPWTNSVAAPVEELSSKRSRYKYHRAHSAVAASSVDFDAEAGRFANYCTRFGIRQA